jgi:aminoglycoside phosphotransferase (APT) family kinase protein
MSQSPHVATEAAIHALLNVALPGSTLVTLRQSDNDHFNTAYILDIQTATGEPRRLLVKRYEPCDEDLVEKARREFTALTWLQRSGVPAPQPLYVDETGAFLGAPALVSTFVNGTQIWQPADTAMEPRQWIREMAATLVQIHRTPCDPDARAFLRNGAAQSLWVLGNGVMPAQMNNHPLGATVWQTIVDCLPGLEPVEPGLVHIDYWRGNLLWDQGRVAAVLDWEEASLGEAGEDVAYCRMDLWASVSAALADEFLHWYEQESGRPVANLVFWELAAATRPIWRPEGWHVTPGEKERFQQFVEHALRRAKVTKG